MAVLIVVSGLLAALVVVLVAAHLTKPARLWVGVRTRWGVLGIEVERPFYADARDPDG